MRGRGHIRLRDATFATRNYRWETEAFAYPLENNTVVRPYEATCFEPVARRGGRERVVRVHEGLSHPARLQRGYGEQPERRACAWTTWTRR